MPDRFQRLCRTICLTLLTCLALLLIPAQARAADPLTITVGGIEYDIQFFADASFNDNAGILETMPWWGGDRQAVAIEFRDAYLATTTSPPLFHGSSGSSKLLFAYDIGVKEELYFIFDEERMEEEGYVGDFGTVEVPVVLTEEVVFLARDSILTSTSNNEFKPSDKIADFNYAYISASRPAAVLEINAGSLSHLLLILLAFWLVMRRRVASHDA
jgi:hypothetical protein